MKDGERQDSYQVTIWTVGHSIHSREGFNEILIKHRMEVVADVRAFPSSRRYPHFNKEILARSLACLDVGYQHLPTLGGRRKPSAESRNTALKNTSFRAYADYMETDAFRRGIGSLLELAARQRTAVMCAEALWWRCHRSLIADYLKVQRAQVIHIMSATKSEVHLYTAAASVEEGRLSYGGLLGDIDPEVTS